MKKQKCISIQIPIQIDDYLRDFIFKNINMRRHIRNDFVEEANKYKDKYNHYYGFNAQHYHQEYFNNVEKPEDRYYNYCVGLSEQVAKDIRDAINTMTVSNEKIWKMYNKNKDREILKQLSSFKFQKRDNCYGTFKVHTKAQIRNGNISSRIKIAGKNTLYFRVRGGAGSPYPREVLTLHLLEDLYDTYDENKGKFIRYYKDGNLDKKSNRIHKYNDHECRFDDLDIKNIVFIHHLGKFYIQLDIEAKFYINEDEYDARYEKAGIDTGIRNPIMLYDGDKYISFRMDGKTCRKIHNLEERSKMLQKEMCKKYRINIENGRNPYSKNYEEVREKFRKVENKIVNIKRDWAYKTSKYIVTHYQSICVDKYTVPTCHEHEDLPKKVINHVNYTNRFHSMYNTNEILEHMADKYGTNYYESPKKSTRTCSECGHVNPPLSLSQEIFKCEKCGYETHRDKNASKICYNHI